MSGKVYPLKGNQARAVIPRLAHAGMRVRAMRRSDRPGPGPKDLGAAEVIVDGDKMHLARERECFEDLIRGEHLFPA